MNEVEALKELLVQRLDGQDRILRRIEDQTTKTNGRVTALERLWEGFLARLNGHDREIRDVKRWGQIERKPAAPDANSYGKREVTIFLAGGASLIAAYRFVVWMIQEMAQR